MKISFCTTCMDRLFHLKETYLQNIENSSSYQNREFILLNYNSQDSIDSWVRENLKNHLKSGLVKYYKTTEAKWWVAAHAKNIAHKQADGDLLCNLDCDNFVVPGFCEYVVGLFAKGRFEKDIILAAPESDPRGNRGTCGMITCRKEHFYSVNGYDESINLGWSMEDTNFQFRCRMHNNLDLAVLDINYTKCIGHGNETRTKNCQLKDPIFTKKVSENLTIDCAAEKNYIANKDVKWGEAQLVKILK